MKTALSILLMLLPCLAFAEIIPSTNTCAWALAGVVGGIPNRTSETLMSDLDDTGVTNETATVQGYIDAAPADEVLVFPPGTFKISSALSFKNDISFRGSGSNSVVRPGAPWVFENGGGGDINWNLHATIEVGDTNFVSSNAPTALQVGCVVQLRKYNLDHWPSPYGYEDETVGGFPPTTTESNDDPSPATPGTRNRAMQVIITAIDNNTNFTFSPPAYYQFATGGTDKSFFTYPAYTSGPANMRSGVGFESLIIDPTHGGNIFWYDRAVNCWITNCHIKIRATDTPSVRGFRSAHISVIHNTFEGFVQQSSAVVPFVQNDWWLVENNIMKSVNQAFIMVGSGGGNVFAYNYVHSITNGTTAMIAEVGNHQVHNQYILVEGNVFWHALNDSIHGSSEKWSFFRNWVLCRKPGSTFGHGGIWIDHTNYFNSIVGNVMGYHGTEFTNGYGFQFEQESEGDGTIPGIGPDTVDAVLMFRYAFSGYNAWANDPDCKGTTINHGNYIVNTNGTYWDTNIVDQNIPDSLYLSSKPGWYGNLTYPAFGDTGATNLIPAHYREINGTDPPAESSDPPTPNRKGPGKSIFLRGPGFTGPWSSNDYPMPSGYTLHHPHPNGNALAMFSALNYIFAADGSHIDNLFPDYDLQVISYEENATEFLIEEF